MNSAFFLVLRGVNSVDFCRFPDLYVCSLFDQRIFRGWKRGKRGHNIRGIRVILSVVSWVREKFFAEAESIFKLADY